MNNNQEAKKSFTYDQQKKPESAQQSKSEQSVTQAMRAEIKKTWSKLSDEDIDLYDSEQGLFFKKVNEKQNISPQDAKQKIERIKETCGCGTKSAAA
jgi:hypothetical protein